MWEHAMSWPFPEGCSCGASEHNAIVTEAEQLRAEVTRLRGLLDRARPQLVAFHGLICDNLEGAAVEQIVNDLVADIVDALAAGAKEGG